MEFFKSEIHKLLEFDSIECLIGGVRTNLKNKMVRGITKSYVSFTKSYFFSYQVNLKL